MDEDVNPVDSENDAISDENPVLDDDNPAPDDNPASDDSPVPGDDTAEVDPSQVALGPVQVDDWLASNDAGTLWDSEAVAQFDTGWASDEGVA